MPYSDPAKAHQKEQSRCVEPHFARTTCANEVPISPPNSGTLEATVSSLKNILLYMRVSRSEGKEGCQEWKMESLRGRKGSQEKSNDIIKVAVPTHKSLYRKWQPAPHLQRQDSRHTNPSGTSWYLRQMKSDTTTALRNYQLDRYSSNRHQVG